MFKISLLIIGSELLKGITQDTNSYWISNFIRSSGFSVNRIITVDDSAQNIKENFNLLWKDSDFVIVTGGLGPTKDDITKQIFADIFHFKITNNSDAQKISKNNFIKQNRQNLWNKDLGYNYTPIGFTVLDNPVGLAPCFSYRSKKSNKKLLLLPGVPREVEAFCSKYLDSYLPTSTKKLINFSIKTYGINEEKIFFDLCPNLWEQLSHLGTLSCLPSASGVTINITIDSQQSNKKSLQEQIKKTIQNSKLKPFVWQYGELSFSEYLLKRAKEKQRTIAFGESCTGGLSANLLTDISGCSSVFMGSAVTYSNQSKISLLKVNKETIDQFGAVSLEVVKEMSQGVLKLFNCDFALSFSGIAGPLGGTDEKPVGTVAICWASKKQSYQKFYHFNGDRILLKERFFNQGIYNLLSQFI